jgi:hypothetical protein
MFGPPEYANPKSLNTNFTFFICSKGFKNAPTKEYKKYVERMLVQDEYDSVKARIWLEKRIAKIGEVNEDELTKQLHDFLETEEWDFDITLKDK